MVLSTILLNLGLCSNVLCCGIGVHLTLLERTRPQQLSYLDRVNQPGVWFPDAFYSCMGLSDAAEYAHWPPFLKLAVDYWREKYGGVIAEVNNEENFSFRQKIWQRVFNIGRSAEYDKAIALKAFIYAILGHQVADVSWHSLGLHQGLLDMISAREFGGDVSAAHKLLDTGGDVIYLRNLLESEQSMQWYDQKWEYPKSDILEIYRRAGFWVLGSQLDYCMLRGRAAIRLELYGSKVSFNAFASRSPLLFDQLDEYYLGGITEMTTAIKHCNHKLDAWFESGTPFDPWTLCEIFRHRKIKSYAVLDVAVAPATPGESTLIEAEIIGLRGYPAIGYQQTLDGDSKPFQGHTGQFVLLANYSGQLSLAVSSPFMPRYDKDDATVETIAIGGVDLVPIDKIKDRFQCSENILSDVERIQPRPVKSSFFGFNERFGAQVAIINVKGRHILVISRPGISAIEFHFEGEPLLQVVWQEAQLHYGGNGTKLMGERLLVADIDGDGLDDLIIGSPLTDVDTVPQQGEVHIIRGVFLSEIFAEIFENDPESLEILQLPIEYMAPVSLTVPTVQLPDARHKKGGNPKRRGYNLFGSKLSIVKDSDQKHSYLLVGSEGSDTVYGFSGKGFDLAFTLKGDLTDTKYGGSLLQGTESGVVAVGASSEGTSQCVQCGAVYIYRVSDGRPKLTQKILGEDVLDGQYIRFGYEGAAVDDKTLFVTSPSAQNQNGALWAVHLPSASVRQVDVSMPSKNSGFGTSIAAGHFENAVMVFIGVPYHISNHYGDGLVVVYRFDAEDL